MNPKISIIIPIYNVKEYLPKCIKSILMQTFKEFELILVNDGSSDESGEICNEFARQDARVKVIHKENKGVSSARNNGLKVATGEYIGFVDSDDFIHERMFELLYGNAIRYSSDLVVCDFTRITEEDSIKLNHVHTDVNALHYTNVDALLQLFSNKDGVTLTSTGQSIKRVVVWNKLIRKSLFDDLSFEEHRIFEDEIICHRLLYKSKKTTYIPHKLYYYVKRPNSILNSGFTVRKLDKVHALRDRAEFFQSMSLTMLHEMAVKSYADVFFLYYFRAESELKDVKKELVCMRRSFIGTLPHLLRNSLIGWKQKLVFIIFVASPFLFEKMGSLKHLKVRRIV